MIKLSSYLKEYTAILGVSTKVINHLTESNKFSLVDISDDSLIFLVIFVRNFMVTAPLPAKPVFRRSCLQK